MFYCVFDEPLMYFFPKSIEKYALKFFNVVCVAGAVVCWSVCHKSELLFTTDSTDTAQQHLKAADLGK